jgi:hypothetical protein
VIVEPISWPSAVECNLFDDWLDLGDRFDLSVDVRGSCSLEVSESQRSATNDSYRDAADALLVRLLDELAQTLDEVFSI